MIIKEFFYSIKKYFQAEKEYFINDKEEIAKKNMSNLYFLSWAGFISTSLCIILARLIIPNWRVTAYHELALVFFLCCGIFLAYLRHLNKDFLPKGNLIEVFFYIGLISVCISICVFPYPDQPQVFVSLIYLMLPSILILSMKTNLLLIGISEIFFVSLAYIYKPTNIAIFDIYSTATAFIFSFVVVYVVISLRIHDYQSRDKYKALSIKDSLCNIYNRRAFETYSKIFIETHQNTYALAIIDIDDFKDVNDNYGHRVGDTALIYLSEILEKKLNHKGIVGRFGGDEFCSVIEFNGKVDELINFFISVQDEYTQKTQEKIGVSVNFSVGISISYSNTPVDYDYLFLMADNALYSSKRTNKGKINISYSN